MKIAPPTLFSATALAASNDPDLPDGTHVRVLSAAELGPPIAPIALWRGGTHTIGLGTQTGVVQLDATASAVAAGSVVVAIEASSGALLLTDTLGGEIARRSAGPVIAAAPMVQRAQVSSTTAVIAHIATPGDLDLLISKQTAPILVPMPAAKPSAWYAGGVGGDVAMQRVVQGAPKRKTPLDQPAGGFDALSPADEQKRIAPLANDLLKQVSLLVAQDMTDGSGKTIPPASRSQSASQQLDPNNPPQTADVPLWGSLILQSADYGVARFLGLAGILPLLPKPAGAPPVLASVQLRSNELVWAAGLFALAPDALVTTGDDGVPVTLVDWPVDPGEQTVINALSAAVPGLAAVIAHAQQAGLTIRAAITGVAVPPPPDAPRLGAVLAGKASWIPSMEWPNVGYRQAFNLGNVMPTVAGLAFASDEAVPGAPQPRNPVGPSGRHIAMLVGRDLDGVVILQDVVLKASATITYRFAGADLFGRFGAATTCVIHPPARPAPPKPAPQVAIVRGNVPVHAPGLLPPGKATVTIPVPAIDTLPAGALPIAKLITNFGTFPLDATKAATLAISSGIATITIDPLPTLAPMATGTWTFEARFADQSGTLSPIASIPITVADKRSPPPILAGPGLVWTSRANAAATVEAALSWPAGPGAAGYHIYVASAGGLKATMAQPIDLKTASRAAIGYAGTSQGASHPRAAFSRLTVDPVPVGADGKAHYRLALPRAQRTVSFVRIVPVSAGGIEAEFSACALVPVAVPVDLPPPPPHVSGMVTAAGAVMLTIEATGLAFPGASASSFAASIRLRRAIGQVRDPLYARILSPAQPLVAGVSPGTTSATVTYTDAEVRPFVPATWWADVALPPEPVLPAGIAAQPDAVQPDYAWQQQPMTAPFSRLSVPFTVVPTPQNAPAALTPAQIGISLATVSGFNFPQEQRKITVAIGNAPHADPHAIAPYLLRVWLRTADVNAAPVQIFEVPIDQASFSYSYTSPNPIGSPQSCWFMIIDPIGRESDITKIDLDV